MMRKRFQQASRELMGQRIQFLREQAGMRREDLALELDISTRMMANLEEGKYSPYKHISKLSEIFNVNPTELMIRNPALVTAFRSVDYMIPVYMTKRQLDDEKAVYYYNAPDWIVQQYLGVFAIEAGAINKSSILIDEEGVLFIAPRVDRAFILPDQLILVRERTLLKVIKMKDKQKTEKRLGLILAQERRFV